MSTPQYNPVRMEDAIPPAPVAPAPVQQKSSEDIWGEASANTDEHSL
jgi:hypothetical protein